MSDLLKFPFASMRSNAVKFRKSDLIDRIGARLAGTQQSKACRKLSFLHGSENLTPNPSASHLANSRK